MMRVGQLVRTDWRGYGVYYWGFISAVNANGMFDIDYEDGDQERSVLPDRILSSTGGCPSDTACCVMS